jgi:hypothetical protein
MKEKERPPQFLSLLALLSAYLLQSGVILKGMGELFYGYDTEASTHNLVSYYSTTLT